MSKITTNLHPLLTEDIIAKLQERNINIIDQFCNEDANKLSKITNLTYKNVITIKKNLYNKNAAVTRRADLYFKELQRKTAIIQCGIKWYNRNQNKHLLQTFKLTSLDDILGGGFYTGQIYEICGPPASGKTRLCYKIMENYIKSTKNPILFVDTKQEFSPCQFQLTDDNLLLLKNVIVKQTHSINALINILHDIKAKMLKKFSLRVIIIDSLPCLIYTMEANENRNFLLTCLVNVMRFIAAELHVVIIVVNLTTTWFDFQQAEKREKLEGGKYWESIPNVRLKLTECREINVIKSNNLINGKHCVIDL